MDKLQIRLRFCSDATLGRGDGVAGLVDEEVEYDMATGLPFMRGRVLKGLLVEECANILYALGNAKSQIFEESARFLFGQAGSHLEDEACMRVGPALLPADLRRAVQAAVEAKKLTPTAVLESLTTIRRQTAVDEESGAPDEGSLRAMRVVIRETVFVSPLYFVRQPDNADNCYALLAACVAALRRAGTGRNRGRGRLQARLYDAQGNDWTDKYLPQFTALIQEGK